MPGFSSHKEMVACLCLRSLVMFATVMFMQKLDWARGPGLLASPTLFPKSGFHVGARLGDPAS